MRTTMWGFYPITVKREANGNDNESDGDNGDGDDGDHLLDGIWLGISENGLFTVRLTVTVDG